LIKAEQKVVLAKSGAWSGEAEARRPASLNGAFFWLSAFYFVYCARPEEWIPGLLFIPLAKISGFLALLGLLTSLGRTQRKFRDLPQESGYLLALICLLFLSALLSPVWKGGAVSHTLDFAKVYVIWILTFLLVTDFKKLRRLIYIQTASVAVISAVSILKGHSRERLEGVIGGIYSNPNDLAFAIVLTLPFCLAFVLSAKRLVVKVCWTAAVALMGLTLFMTASRAGFIMLVVSGIVCLWHFGVKGRRFYLIGISALAVVVLLAVAGGPLFTRMSSFSGNANTELGEIAYDSYEARKFLMYRAIDEIKSHPILGLGVGDFQVVSGDWHDVHMTYLQVAVEGGIPALILYLLFFFSGFRNVNKLLRRRDLDSPTRLFVGGLHGSMIGFVVGASFAPEAYQFFPYFAVGYTSVLVAMMKDGESATEPVARTSWRNRPGTWRAVPNKPAASTVVR